MLYWIMILDNDQGGSPIENQPLKINAKGFLVETLYPRYQVTNFVTFANHWNPLETIISENFLSAITRQMCAKRDDRQFAG